MNLPQFIIKGKGPILITSPHTIKTLRDDIIHVNELYIYKIIEKMYQLLGPDLATLFTWNPEYFQQNDIIPNDPNFLDDLSDNNWWKMMLKLQKRGTRYLHFDIHGMSNESTDNDIEFGLKAMELHSPYRFLLLKHLIQSFFNQIDAKIGYNSQFQGWKQNKYTVTNQGILLGFDSCQIELTKEIRTKIYKDDLILRQLVDSIRDIFTQLYIPPIPNVRPRIAILSIPIYNKLKQSIPNGRSYISDDYVKLVKDKFNCDPILIPYHLDKKKLLRILPYIGGLIIPGGSYGNTQNEPVNKQILYKFIDNFLELLNTIKELCDQGLFIPIIGICLGFQLLCLSNCLNKSEIVNDIHLKESGIIIRRLSQLGICDCNLKDRFEHVIHLPYDNARLNFFIFSNKRIIPYTPDTVKKLNNIDITGIYINKLKMSIIASIKYKDYPFIGFQYHPEKNIQIQSPYMQHFYNELHNIFHIAIQASDDKFTGYKHDTTYTNKRNVTYYIFY